MLYSYNVIIQQCYYNTKLYTTVAILVENNSAIIDDSHNYQETVKIM